MNDGTAEETSGFGGAGGEAGADGGQGAMGAQGQGDAGAAGGQGDAGGAGDAWYASLPEAHHEALKGYESMDAMLDALKGGEVPDAYTAPEGVTVDGDVFNSFTETAKELGLTQAQMEGIIKFDAQRMEEFAPKMLERVEAENEKALGEYAKEVGPEAYKGSLANANKAIKHFGGDEAIKWMSQHKLLNAPAMIKVFAEIGAAMQEDTGIHGDGHQRGEKTHAERMFPSMK